MDTPIGHRVSDEVIERGLRLPLKPDPVTLVGPCVELVPLDLDRDVEALHAVSNGQPVDLRHRSIGPYDPDELIWRYMVAGPFPDAAALRAYLQPLVESPNGLCLCVIDRPSAKPIGVTNYLNNAPEHLRVELGSLWYSPVAQGTSTNTEATYLMLRHAFGLSYRRLEWKCNARNTRSWRAAERMGFKLEGVLEGYSIRKGCNRDSAWFRMLDTEWPAAERNLRELLSRE
ncbi:MAG: GNAT family N-acetyltransferase [Chloroflexota bacterium]|nr:GNAT family N-acetyltransferase [Chloroflexota bacterium]